MNYALALFDIIRGVIFYLMVVVGGLLVGEFILAIFFSILEVIEQ